MKCVFAGPSLASCLEEKRNQSPEIIFYGPARCGDVLKATKNGATAIGLIDGYFETVRSVMHKEILYALSLGVAVYGGSSMGALRAFECRHFGMIGVGKIYDQFVDGTHVDDADVSQVHAPEELHYASLSDPLVNILPTFRKLREEFLVTETERDLLEATARCIYYKDRSYKNVLQSSNLFDGQRQKLLLDWIAINAVDLKRLDALAVVDRVANFDEAMNAPLAGCWKFSDTDYWRRLEEEL